MNGSPIAESTPSDDQNQYQRKYTNGALYSSVTGYFTIGQGNAGIESAEETPSCPATPTRRSSRNLNAI